MNTEQCHALFSRLQAQNSHPTTELVHSSPFELLVAVILSAQATDKIVNKVTAQLFKVANTPETMLTLGQTQLNAAIKSIGLHEKKAKNIIKTSEMILTQHQGQLPDNRTDLEALPGVGRKTANVILNTVFGQPTIGVDTHIFRVANRTGLAEGKTVQAVEKLLLTRVPTEFMYHAHHWLVLHGRYVCIARKPKCEQCLIADLCQFNSGYVVE
jgi:endonuclease-3